MWRDQTASQGMAWNGSVRRGASRVSPGLNVYAEPLHHAGFRSWLNAIVRLANDRRNSSLTVMWRSFLNSRLLRWSFQNSIFTLTPATQVQSTPSLSGLMTWMSGEIFSQGVTAML